MEALSGQDVVEGEFHKTVPEYGQFSFVKFFAILSPFFTVGVPILVTERIFEQKFMEFQLLFSR